MTGRTKVWVTGAAGMLGRDVVETLRTWKLPHVATGHEIDVAEAEAVGEFVSRHAPTHVVNCAAFTRVDDAEASETLATRVNALGPQVLGRAASTIGACVVHYSTDYVFSGTQEHPYREEDPPAPVNAYGRSKLDGERRLRAACPSSFVVRASWLFGVGGPNFVATILDTMSTRDALDVVDDQHGRPTYAPDLARASLSLAGLGPRAAANAEPGLYHFANAGETTWHGLATGIREAALRRGLPVSAGPIRAVSTDAAPRPAPRPMRAVLDTTRIEQVLGRSPRAWAVALDEYLERRREGEMNAQSRAPRRILVTGGCGFIGSAFVRWLFDHHEALERVVNLDALTYAANPENVAAVADDPRYVFVHDDIRDRACVTSLCDEHEIDTIVHFAAESHVDRSIRGPLVFVETNVLGTAALLEVVRARPRLHFHHVSTDEVYGSLGEAGSFDEQSPYRPNSPYAASKAASDHLVRAYAHTYGIPITISNCSNNYGPAQFPEKLVPLMISRLLDREPLPIYGDGANVRDWIYVDDHAAAIWSVLTRGRAGETYNVGAGDERTNLELVHALIDEFARKTGAEPGSLRSLVTFVEDRPGHDLRYAIDARKTRSELGWTPAHALARGLELTVDWYLAHPDWLARAKQ